MTFGENPPLTEVSDASQIRNTNYIYLFINEIYPRYFFAFPARQE
ncbi:hypothetical protein L579_3530 [Pantoea sp. AS-PWVM4]|nr:hypothetical protein L579_3530 [Pantoea sp. AS-PWVM4]